jgi:hypothetical protein
MNRKYDKQLQNVQAAFSANQASISSLQSRQAQLSQQMTRLTIAQGFERYGVTRQSHPWPQLAGSK